jgi:hypothetical protein
MARDLNRAAARERVRVETPAPIDDGYTTYAAAGGGSGDTHSGARMAVPCRPLGRWALHDRAVPPTRCVADAIPPTHGHRRTMFGVLPADAVQLPHRATGGA